VGSVSSGKSVVYCKNFARGTWGKLQSSSQNLNHQTISGTRVVWDNNLHPKNWLSTLKTLRQE